MRVSRLNVISIIVIVKFITCSAIYQPSIFHNYKSECLDDLDIRYNYEPKCLTKCIYEKEGRLDSNGNFILTGILTEPSDIPQTCLNLIETSDVCNKAQLLDECITHKSNRYLQNFKECEKYIHYNDESIGKVNHCYNRCCRIMDGHLDGDGKVNISAFNYPSEAKEEALKICKEIIVDDDDCIRDLNTFECLLYILRHSSEKQLKDEIECGKANKVYPFRGVDPVKSRTCYDRCLLIKSGELDENNIINSESFKKININNTNIEELYKTCKKTMRETDKCNEDYYFYDCINVLINSNPEYVKNLKECAEETQSPLTTLRDSDEKNSCLDRCLMIKEKQLENDGSVNRNELKQFSINATILDESISECQQYVKNKTCQDDVNTYYCVTGKINDKVLKLCRNISNSDIFRSITSMGIDLCSRRCLMINDGKLTPTGEINTENFNNKDIDDVKEFIKKCDAEVTTTDVCAKDVHRYYCVSSKIKI